MERITYINVPVPEALVPEVMALIIKRTQASNDTVTPYKPTNGAFAALVERSYLESEPSHRKLLNLLADHEDQRLKFSKVSEAMGYTSPRSLPGTLGAFGRRAKHRYGGFKPFEAEEDITTGEWTLKMDAATAEVIKKVGQTK